MTTQTVGQVGKRRLLDPEERIEKRQSRCGRLGAVSAALASRRRCGELIFGAHAMRHRATFDRMMFLARVATSDASLPATVVGPTGSRFQRERSLARLTVRFRPSTLCPLSDSMAALA